MSTTTDTSTERVARTSMTLIPGDAAFISASPISGYPRLGEYSLTIGSTGSDVTVYLTQEQARSMYHRLGDALIAAEAVSA